MQIRNLQQQAIMIKWKIKTAQKTKQKKKTNAGTCWKKKEKPTLVKMTKQLEEINMNIQAKEGKFKKISRQGRMIEKKKTG